MAWCEIRRILEQKFGCQVRLQERTCQVPNNAGEYVSQWWLRWELSKSGALESLFHGTSFENAIMCIEDGNRLKDLKSCAKGHESA